MVRPLMSNEARFELPVSELSQMLYEAFPFASRTVLVSGILRAQDTQAEPLKCMSDWRLGLPPIVVQAATLPLLAL